eukprot:TRINITY_DN406_c1_g1_i2.p1 TRINITY_DN406_c1_g1~~TRINITY_DN406_c1_g1_i2.p1  ORF type:complete len:111 (-),score=19.76 TRINITY_DN406_c1_g1_i2:67-399(-)
MSDGTIYDYCGGTTAVNKDKRFTAYGRVTKTLKIDLSSIAIPADHAGRAPAAVWDDAVAVASEEFSQLEHKFFRHDSHHHVCSVLNRCSYLGRKWSPFSLIVLLIKEGEW